MPHVGSSVSRCQRCSPTRCAARRGSTAIVVGPSAVAVASICRAPGVAGMPAGDAIGSTFATRKLAWEPRSSDAQGDAELLEAIETSELPARRTSSINGRSPWHVVESRSRAAGRPRHARASRGYGPARIRTPRFGSLERVSERPAQATSALANARRPVHSVCRRASIVDAAPRLVAIPSHQDVARSQRASAVSGAPRPQSDRRRMAAILRQQRANRGSDRQSVVAGSVAAADRSLVDQCHHRRPRSHHEHREATVVARS